MEECWSQSDLTAVWDSVKVLVVQRASVNQREGESPCVFRTSRVNMSCFGLSHPLRAQKKKKKRME